MTIRPTYECSSEGAVRHWEVLFARLQNVAPTPTQPAEITSLLPGTAAVGTVLTTDAARTVAEVDFTHGMVYKHNLRNTLTYNPGVAELTWGAVNIGDPVYYDPSVITYNAGSDTYLSKSPLDTTGAANALFGFVVAIDDVDAALFPKAPTAAAETLANVAIMQRGA
jgi:hypothetical protein